MPVFEFVDQEDPTARTRAKSHVARNAHRDRRLREIEAYHSRVRPAPKAVQYADRTSTSTPDTPQVDQPIKQQSKQELPPPQYKNPETTLTPPDSEADSGEDVETIGSSGEPTGLDTYASRVAARPQDSFWTVYSQLNTGDRNLLQWCKSALSLAPSLLIWIRPC